MKRSLLILLIGCCFLGEIIAQPAYGGFKKKGSSIKGKITGRLIDSMTNEAIGYATIVLMKPDFNKQINGTISEDDGKFKLSEVSLGKYRIQISFLGYKDKMIQNIELTPKKPDVNLENIFLAANNVVLDEVTVTEEAPIIMNKIDKIVYNAEKDPNVAGGDAADVLRKVPLLTVDLQGNVSLRGSTNIRVLVNGKPSGMFANNIADALKMIPADEIKNVEVITSPSAKYDGEGSAGIVNIITKKKNVDGFSGNFNGSLGTRQNNATLSLSAAKGRFGVNASGSTYYSWPNDGNFTFNRNETTPQGSRILTQNGITENERIGFRGRAGAFYDFNAYNSINSSFSIGGHSFDRDGNTNFDFTDPIANLSQTYSNHVLQGTLNSNYDWTTDYQRKYKNPDKEFSMSFQLSGNINDSNTKTNQSANDAALAFNEQSDNKGRNTEYTIQTDYTHPFNKKITLETGAKSVLRRINSDYIYEVLDQLSGNFINDPNRSNEFDYFQDVYAGYASFRINLDKKHSLIAGARYEYTDITGNFNTGGLTVDNDYDNLLPNFILSKKLKNFNSIKLAYTERIQRPSLFFINPFTQDSDRRNLTVGNPNLKPELTRQIELTYTTFIKGSIVSSALYYKRTNDVIQQFLTVDDQGVSIQTYNNIGLNNAYGANIFTSVNIKKFLTLRANINFNYSIIDGFNVDGSAIQNKGLVGSGFLSSSFNFKKGYKAEIFAFGRSRSLTIQGRVASFDMISVGIQKELWNKRGSIGIRIVEPWRPDKKFTTELTGDNFTQFSEFVLPFQSFGINFSYRFGKLNFKQRRSKIKNDDLKGGDDGNQGGRNFNN